MNHKNLETIYFKIISSEVHCYILHVTWSHVNVVTIWINKLFLLFPVHSFFRAFLVFLAGCCCRNTIDDLSPCTLMLSLCLKTRVSSFSFIYSFLLKTAPLGINHDSLHQGVNLLSPCDGVCDQHQEVKSDSLMSLEFLEL